MAAPAPLSSDSPLLVALGNTIFDRAEAQIRTDGHCLTATV
jgi:hypothetical protein